MSRQPLSELPLHLFLPSLFPLSPSHVPPFLSPHTPHPGAYKLKAPSSPHHKPEHLHPHGHGKKRSLDAELAKEGGSAKRRHLEGDAFEGETVAKRLFGDLTRAKKPNLGTSTPARSKKPRLAPSPEIAPKNTTIRLPNPASVKHPASAPTTSALPKHPKPATRATLSVPSSSTVSRSPTPKPEEEDKENHPPRPRRHPSLLSPSTPRMKLAAPSLSTKGKTQPREQPSIGATLGLGKTLGLGVGKPATPREIGRSMMLREVEEPEEVEADEEML